MAKMIMYDNGDGVSIVCAAPGVVLESAAAATVPKGA